MNADYFINTINQYCVLTFQGLFISICVVLCGWYMARHCVHIEILFLFRTDAFDSSKAPK